MMNAPVLLIAVGVQREDSRSGNSAINSVMVLAPIHRPLTLTLTLTLPLTLTPDP
jgi:hypothetical protein